MDNVDLLSALRPSNSDHYQFSLLYGNQSQKPAFYAFKAIVKELTGNGTGTLGPSESLAPNQSIVSDNDWFELIYQTNGNLEMIGDEIVLWETITSDANEVAMQPDGNLVVYNTVPAVVWSSGTGGNGNGYLVLQSDGELRLYNASGGPVLTLFSIWY
jgi:hypothetical protein